MRALWTALIAPCAVAGLAITTLAASAHAQQKFPTKPVRVVVGYGVGGQPDTLIRLIGPKLSEVFGQPVVVENRSGADGTLAAAQVARATADGHTLLFAGGNFAVGAALRPSLPYDPIKDFVGISRVAVGTVLLVVPAKLGAKSVKDFIAMAKARPGKVIFSVPGAAGSANHLNGMRLSHAAGIQVLTVAYKGAPEALVELLAGRADFTVISVAASLPLIKDGQLRALASLGPQRLASLPDVPPITETFPAWKRSEFGFGFLAPAKTPPLILNQISKDTARILDLPDVKDWMLAAGITPAFSPREEYDKIRREEIETLSKLVKDAGLREK